MTNQKIRHLTFRELEILRCIASGMSNPEIADDLLLRLDTVKTHIRRSMAKLGAKNRANLVHEGYRRGYLIISRGTQPTITTLIQKSDGKVIPRPMEDTVPLSSGFVAVHRADTRKTQITATAEARRLNTEERRQRRQPEYGVYMLVPVTRREVQEAREALATSGGNHA